MGRTDDAGGELELSDEKLSLFLVLLYLFSGGNLRFFQKSLYTRLLRSSEHSNRRNSTFPVRLQVYDVLTSSAAFLPLRFYHTGVLVHGREYMFCGATDPNGDGEGRSGIHWRDPDATHVIRILRLRESIGIGRTEMDGDAVEARMRELGGEFTEGSYDVFTKNCNHFSDQACRVLTGVRIPSWINRAAKIGRFCKCLMPMKELEETKTTGKVDERSVFTAGGGGGENGGESSGDNGGGDGQNNDGGGENGGESSGDSGGGDGQNNGGGDGDNGSEISDDNGGGSESSDGNSFWQCLPPPFSLLILV